MKKKTLVSFGDNTINFELPTSWAELSQEQLRVVFVCLTTYDYDVAKVAIFCNLLGVKILRNINDKTYICRVKEANGKVIQFSLSADALSEFLDVLAWIDQPDIAPNRLESIDKNKAVDTLLHGVPFADFLKCENYFQGFLESKDDVAIISIANILYNAKFSRLGEIERYSVTLWFASIKQMFAMQFPHFFKHSEVISDEPVDMHDVMNAQIRALTAGDITKEKDVLSMDCWRALTELDAKAREADEYNSKMKK